MDEKKQIRGWAGFLKMAPLIWFLLGVSCFLIFQILTRIPLLQKIAQSLQYSAFLMANPWNALFAGLLIAFTAGLFEEGERFLFRLLFLGQPRVRFIEPLAFGLGHGLCEAVYIMGPALINYPFQMLIPGLIERILALVAHIGFTFIVWNGFRLSKRWQYLLWAIFAHFAMDAMIPINQLCIKQDWFIWAWISLCALLLLSYAIYSGKFYERGYVNDEKV